MEKHGSDRSNFIKKKLLAIGDEQCGKAAILLAFSSDSNDDKPETFGYCLADVDVNGKTVELALWQAPCQEHYSALRTLSYPETDIILVCFSVDNPESLTNVEKTWMPEVQRHSPDTPFILVGNKTDLRDDIVFTSSLKAKKQKLISTEEGSAVAQKIHALAYFECSTVTGEGVEDLLKAAANATIN